MTMKQHLTNPAQRSHGQALQSARCTAPRAALTLLLAGAVGALSLNAQADEAVSDASAQAVARKILEDYKAERKLNVPRWADLAHDENSGKQADCPAPKAGGKPPVTFKDCNLAYFELRKERWEDVMQSWAVLDKKQKTDLAKQLAPMFESLSTSKSTSLSGQTVAKAYGASSVGSAVGSAVGSSVGGAGADPMSMLAGLMEALGIDGGSDKLIESILKPNGFAKDSKDLFKNLLAAHTTSDIDDLSQTVNSTAAKFKEFKPETAKNVNDMLKLAKFSVDNQKNNLAETGNVSRNSKTRADAVKDITTKIQALGNSTADQSLVSAQLAQYEFYLSALDALGKEELIKAAAQRRGERAQSQLQNAGFEAKRLNDAVARAGNKN
jgi:hypothetical protein